MLKLNQGILFPFDYSMTAGWYMTMLVVSKIPRSRIWNLNFVEARRKISLFCLKLISTRIKIFQIRNNWLRPFFAVPEIFMQNACLSCFIWILMRSQRLTQIQKENLCHSRLLPLMTEFTVFMPLQNIAPRNRSSVTRSKIIRVYSDIKVANNTNIYRKAISFTDHYNFMTIDRSPSKTEDFWHFNNSLLYIIFKNKGKQLLFFKWLVEIHQMLF